MSSPYESRFWKKNWDPDVKDIDPIEFETTYPDFIRDMFEKYPNNMALAFQGLEITFAEVDKRSNQFANMLIENGFKKGDVVGINLANIPEYIYSVVGTLKAGCIVSGGPVGYGKPSPQSPVAVSIWHPGSALTLRVRYREHRSGPGRRYP